MNKPLPTRVPLSETAKQANVLLRINPEGLELVEVEELLGKIGPCLAAHDKDPAHIVEDKGYWRKLTAAAEKRSKALSWLVYSCQTRIKRIKEPDWSPAGYTGRNSQR